VSLCVAQCRVNWQRAATVLARVRAGEVLTLVQGSQPME